MHPDFLSKTRRRLICALALASLVLVAGCATPDGRIKRNQEAFSALAPDEQALIREGKVAIGFNPLMVRLALGDPDQRWRRTDEAGTSEVWSYTTYDNALGAPLYRGYYHRYHGGYPFYYDSLSMRDARPREYLKVVFVAGQVREIEQAER